MGAGAPITVLIVDDHEIVRLGVRAALNELESISVVGEAADGIEAITEALRIKPAVILMDIGMPRLDGIEATKEIKRQLPDTKVLMLTSHEAEEEVLASLVAGADGYCKKGSTPAKILSAINAVAQGAGWLDLDIAGKVFSKRRAKRKQQNPDNLTDREIEVIRLIVQGNGNRELAELLGIGEETAKTHVRNIMNKLGVSSRTHLAMEGLRLGLL